jgi:hypothetical protein
MVQDFAVCGWENSSTKYPWTAIASKLGTDRTGRQCKTRWALCLRPGINKAPWTAAEVKLLRQEATSGKTWYQLEELFFQRTYLDIRLTWSKIQEEGPCSVVADDEKCCHGRCTCPKAVLASAAKTKKNANDSRRHL